MQTSVGEKEGRSYNLVANRSVITKQRLAFANFKIGVVTEIGIKSRNLSFALCGGNPVTSLTGSILRFSAKRSRELRKSIQPHREHRTQSSKPPCQPATEPTTSDGTSEFSSSQNLACR